MEHSPLREAIAATADLEAAGIAVGVADRGRVEFVCRGSVAADPVGPGTVFYGASLTKQIVGLLLARAVVDQSAAVDDPILHWLPGLPVWLAPIRLRHLLHHTSGLPDVTDPTQSVPEANAEVVDRLRQLSLRVLAPGVRYAYTNAGYVLLAEALARIVERPISESASTELFTPLGLTATRLGGPAIRVPGMPDPPGTVGDGGLWTSITDLIGWLRALNSGSLGRAAQRLAETTSRLADGTPGDYAWGVRIGSCPHGRLITHGGSWHGWLAKTVRIPERQVAVAILSLGSTEQAVSEAGVRLALDIASEVP